MPVNQSTSKEEFLKALGLNINNLEDKAQFLQMWICLPFSVALVFSFMYHRKKSPTSGPRTSRRLRAISLSQNTLVVSEYTPLISGLIWNRSPLTMLLQLSGCQRGCGPLDFWKMTKGPSYFFLKENVY